ncbi:MAG: hypothetical protein E6K41_04005 [Gammaproteobacteria bacterium]|nr:MAG: hypothetical protein E6K41_04005 [Gammaproteobacteria bacterium]
MLTICPKCALTLLVTAEDLRVAQGYVRCGRCSSVFNALARLTEERQEPEGPPESAPTQPSVEESPTSTPTSVASAPGEARENDAPPPPPPPAVSDEDAIPDDALEFDPARTDASSVFVEPAPSPEWSAATGTFKAMMAANQEAVQPPEIEPQALKEPRPAKREQPPAGRPPEAAHPPPPQATRPPPPDATASPLELASAHQEGRAPQRAQDTPRPQATSAPDPDPDIEVEIGPEMLASILRVETAAEPRAPASPKPAPAAPPPPPCVSCGLPRANGSCRSPGAPAQSWRRSPCSRRSWITIGTSSPRTHASTVRSPRSTPPSGCISCRAGTSRRTTCASSARPSSRGPRVSSRCAPASRTRRRNRSRCHSCG